MLDDWHCDESPNQMRLGSKLILILLFLSPHGPGNASAGYWQGVRRPIRAMTYDALNGYTKKFCTSLDVKFHINKYHLVLTNKDFKLRERFQT